MKSVAVIGGGAAGMIAAVFAAKNGNRVVLLEKNEKLGKKVYITGKGRCNLTNDCSPEEFLENVVSNAKFLSGPIRSFSPQDAQDFFESLGLKLKTERGDRVYPLSDKASDVTKTLTKELQKRGAEIALNERVLQLIKEDERFCVVTDRRRIGCDSVIVCTGGLSYPSTGSTGDGYAFARGFGHGVTELKPSLTGIETSENFISVQGLSLKNVSLCAKHGKKTLFRETGEMLFTHFGISGPLALSVSALINRIPPEEVTLILDLKPGLDEEKLKKRIERDFAEAKGKTVSNGMLKLMPARLIRVVLSRAGIRGDKRIADLTKNEVQNLVFAMKSYEIGVKRLRPIEEAVITSGGVNVKEIDPRTMESKRVKGLFFAGEVLDLDAFTGGFNLQIAFTTGYIAGNNA